MQKQSSAPVDLRLWYIYHEALYIIYHETLVKIRSVFYTWCVNRQRILKTAINFSKKYSTYKQCVIKTRSNKNRLFYISPRTKQNCDQNCNFPKIEVDDIPYLLTKMYEKNHRLSYPILKKNCFIIVILFLVCRKNFKKGPIEGSLWSLSVRPSVTYRYLGIYWIYLYETLRRKYIQTSQYFAWNQRHTCPKTKSKKLFFQLYNVGHHFLGNNVTISKIYNTYIKNGSFVLHTLTET